MNYRTAQEEFWAGDFGADYISRNRSDELLASNRVFFQKALAKADIRSCVELGANVGMNLRALRDLYPGLETRAVEINPQAANELRHLIGPDNVIEGSLLEASPKPADLAFTKGVLIHINPDELPTAYDRLFHASKRFVLVAEYYNPSPVSIPYRGHDDRLFKRDFAGEMMERHPLELIDYGFAYRRDKYPQDDIHWFLMAKR